MSHHEASNTIQIVGMASNPKLNRVWQLADPLCLAEGMELVHIEYGSEHGGRILRLYLDKPGGVTLDDCANISRQLGDILDVGLETQASYRLEVSSPGIQRPLGRLDDFSRFKGCRAKIRTATALDGQKNFTGILDGVSGSTVQLTIDNRSVAIAFADIVKAHLINMNGENA